MGRRKRGRSLDPAGLTVIAALAGLCCMAVCGGVFAALIRFVLGDMHFAGFLGGAAVFAGGYAGAYLSGKLRRRRGILSGVTCAALMYVMASAAELLIFRHILSAKNLLLLLIAGIAGGIFGVNSKRPGWLRDQ